MQLGQVLAQSGFFDDSRQAAQAVVKVLAGRELGVGPIAAMTGIYIVKGKPSIGANLMAGVIKRSGRYNYRIRKHDANICEIEFMERNGDKWESVGVSTFTIDDARKAGTQNLEKFARNMLFARAMSNGARWYCPDCFGGAPVYTPEEMGVPVNEDGEVIDAQYTVAPVIQTQTPPPTPAQQQSTTPRTHANQPPNGGNGASSSGDKPRMAVIKTPAYAAQVQDFAKSTPYYQTQTGLPDSGHILGAAVKLGYPEITSDNLGAMWGALRQYAADQEQRQVAA